MSSAGDWPMWVASGAQGEGRLLPGGSTVVSTDDPGFLFGEAVFTTLALRGGRPALLARHLERLGASIEQLFGAGAELGGAAAERARFGAGVAALAERLSADSLSDAALRLTYSPGAPGAGPLRLVQSRAAPEPWPRPGVLLALESELRVAAGDPLERHKHANRLAKRRALAAARGRGAFEALLRSTSGEWLEATRANLILVRAGRALTPPLDSGCLPGILRGWLVEHGEVTEARIGPDDLRTCSELLLCSSVRGVLPVAGLQGSDGRLVKTLAGEAGQVFGRLDGLVRDL